MNAEEYRACVGIMLVNAEGRVFVGQRLDNLVEAWQMPQGGIDPGETPEQAALRELTEETGIDPAHVRIVALSRDELAYDLPEALRAKLWGGRYRGQRQRWFLMRLEAGDEVIDIATEHQEFRAWRWEDVDRLDALIVPFKRELYAKVIAEFRELV